ncbi:hypothetical protein JCM14469_36200 [Desulfatiferula olefinivorans]
MRRHRPHLSPLLGIILSIALFSCGSVSDDPVITLSGQVSFGDPDPDLLGPVFVAVLSSNPMAPGASLNDALVTIQSIDKADGRFHLSLTGTGLAPGDPVYIIAFADNDFINGIPDPGPGDVIGYYLDPAGFSPAYVLAAGHNEGIAIDVSKTVYDFAASLSGEVLGADHGTVTVFAYAGDIDSLDFSRIDPYEILGYTRIRTGDGPSPFSVTILPYGYPVPIEQVYLIAFDDANGNGTPDAGDRLGFMADDRGLPELLTIEPGRRDGLAVTLSLTLPEPSGAILSLEGRVEVAPEFDADDTPLFVLVIRNDGEADLSALAAGGLDQVAAFVRLDPGIREFTVDLTRTGLGPGDSVMVLAVCDREFIAGFPDIGAGDYLGFYQNRTAMAVDVTLTEGVNRIEPSSDTDFMVSRVVVDHAASLVFELDDENLAALSPPVRLDPSEHVTVVAVQEGGVTLGLNPQIDMDYIIGLASLVIPDTGNDGQIYTLPLLPAFDRRIAVDDPFAVRNVYVFAVFDGNTDGGGRNNYLGYYWRSILGFMTPRLIDRIGDETLALDRTVRFTTRTR